MIHVHTLSSTSKLQAPWDSTGRPWTTQIFSPEGSPPLPTAQILSPRQRSPVGFGGERSSQTPSPQIVATRPTLHTRARPPLLLCNFLLTVVWPILKPLSSEPPLSRRAAMLLAAVVLSGWSRSQAGTCQVANDQRRRGVAALPPPPGRPSGAPAPQPAMPPFPSSRLLQTQVLLC